LRKIAAHPTRSLVTGGQTVKWLWEGIDRIEETLFALRLVNGV